MKALVVTLRNKYIILRNAERRTKENMMKLLMTAGNEIWKDDEKVRAHNNGNYAEHIRKVFAVKSFVAVTKIDIRFSKEFNKWHIENYNWIGNYPESEIVFADLEENYRPLYIE